MKCCGLETLWFNYRVVYAPGQRESSERWRSALRKCGELMMRDLWTYEEATHVQ